MKTSDAILMALLIVLILAIAYKLTSRGCNREGMMNGESYGFLGGGSYGFLGAEGETFASPYEGRAEVNRRLDMSRGNYRGNDYPYIPQNNNWEYPIYRPQNQYATPEDISSAEAEDWYSATSRDNTGSFNAEMSYDQQGSTMMYHTSEPAIDYSSFITDIIVDPRTHENHNQWVAEMIPFSGTPTMVDNLDEALEAGINFIGLRRPQAVAQYNPTFVTEIDPRILAGNAQFNFQG